MNVFVRKIARYQPEHNGLDRYDGYEEITTKRYDPPIEVSDYHSSPKGVTAIFSSNALRARQTAELYEGERDLPRIYTPLFAEVSFSIKKLLSKSEYEERGSDLVRERFVHAFISDSLDESRGELYERTTSCIDLVRSHNLMNILVISHSFFMKLLEVYIRTDKMLYNRPQLLADHVDPLKKLYDFNTGFDFTLEGDSLSLK